MANQIQLTDVVRRALDANVQYLTTVSKLAVECLETLLGSVTNLTQQQSGRPSPTRSQAAEVPNVAVPQASSVPTIVLDAEAPGHALGVFLVENVLSHRVSARIVVSTFVDPAGREVHPPIKLEPETIILEPNEQVLVRVLAGIDESLAPAVDYRADISIPDLPGTRVPLVLRRRAAPTPVESTAARKPAARSKSLTKTRGRTAGVSRGGRTRKRRARG
ncbi:MAG: hypothetical protein WAV20_05740 [Blastocatellia bacterium]